MVRSKNFVLIKHFKGMPKLSDFELRDEELPQLQDGEYLCQAEWLSVDPYMRPYTARLPLGTTMIGSQVARIIESKNSNFEVGKLLIGYFGWRSHTIVNPTKKSNPLPMSNFEPQVLPDFKDLSPSLALGVLGMTGNTAYFGFKELCQPKPGEVVVVNGAAGAVGSHVGQIAKILGCRVIGFAGTDDKVKWLTDELQFDAAFNYKTNEVASVLSKAAPQGVDCFFDNVGGEMSSTVLNHMNTFGRIALCGSISSYNEGYGVKASLVQPAMISKELRMEGFLVTRWLDRWMEGVTQNLQWIKEGKLKYKETIVDGFENMPNALIGILSGDNTGKAVVRVSTKSQL